MPINHRTMRPRRKAAATGGDPYWQQVSLLMRFDSNTSDSSSNSVAVTNNGVTISSSTKKYGAGAAYFDGSAYLTVPSSASVSGTTDFTIEFWVWIETARDAQIIVPSNGAGLNVALGYGGLRVWAEDPGFATQSTDSLSTQTWNHIAVVRNSETATIYLNGEAKASTSMGTNFAASQFNVGLNMQESLIGYMDDIRITQGAARYTSNFTPPTAAFPNG